MPKIDIDYSNTIIYKITCKDSAITHVYVGHTTNFVQRKHAHKQSCISSKSPNHNCKVYQVIRDNGGWNNWKMEIINFFDCKDHYEARKKEQEYFISLNANLNSIEPMPKPKVIVPLKNKKVKEVFYCSTCKINCNSSKLFEEHNKTKKHLKIVEINPENIIKQKKTQCIFSCVLCNYNCSKKSDYEKHLTTVKHKNKIVVANIQQENVLMHICSCGKSYNHRASLFNHRKTCKKYKDNLENNNTQDDSNISVKTELKNLTSMVLELIKSNTEYMKLINDSAGSAKEIIIDKK
jgi:hypothetical protein